ncbi:MAG: TadE/TadG family type IV pilus assembly protein [Proteocatella sp.]
MKSLKSEKGQAMVEFAIAFLFLLTFLLGIFEFSWLMGNKLLATNASREGARYASVYYGETGYDLEGKVKDAFIFDTTNTHLYKKFLITPSINASDGYITVHLEVEVEPLTKLIWDEAQTINTETSMRLEK